MNRRLFLELAAAVPALASTEPGLLPAYRRVSTYQPITGQGMPGKYIGQVVQARANNCIDEHSGVVDRQVVNRMISGGMRELTGAHTDADAWSSFFQPSDIVGIKLNCSGAPSIMSRPEVVAPIVDSLIAIGIPANHIYLYERFPDQVDSVHYDKFVPPGVNIYAAETTRGAIIGYDPRTYVDVNFFGEEDTRSNMIRLITEKFTKIINVPNMKDHGAAGVTGCLKNIAYGSFSNVARSHYGAKTNTFSFIGTLASTEPLRSKTVLHVMDGLRGIWHGGPFLKDDRFAFYPKQIWFGTDPVAMDRLLIDVIEDKRRAENAISVWNRSMDNVKRGEELNPNVNHFIREPGHIEHASTLGLGVYDKAKIRVRTVQL